MAAAVDSALLKVSFIPGTGRMGRLLARRLADAGLPVFVGSRDAAKGLHTSQLIADASSAAAHVHGGSNAEAAAWGNVIVWTPSGPLQDREALLQTLAPHLENKIIIDVTNVMYFFDESQWGQTSSVLLNQKALQVPAKWTTAFKSTFWKLLEELPDVENPHHTFVAGDDEEAVATTVALVEAIPGFKAVRAGSLANSKIVELLGPRWLLELDKLNGGGKYLSGWRYGV